MGMFPFGRLVEQRPPVADGHREVFVLGAYPSALHVRWEPPPGAGLRAVQALAVDNEPEPFWTGKDQEERVTAWMTSQGWRPEWGSVESVAGLNGPSGQWVQDNLFESLGVERSDAWITDCLDTYRASDAMRAAIDSVYRPFAVANALPAAELAEHPSENGIVSEAQESHLARLRHELETASPQVVVTLGNAALRVFRSLLDVAAGPRKLAADGTYGTPNDISVGGASMRWHPLAHPAAPSVYQVAHRSWARSLS